MPPGLRKLLLTFHITVSVGSLGGVLVFLVLAVIGLGNSDVAIVRAVYVANSVIAWTVILPLLSASLATGLVQSLGTSWGLFRHYWVLAKLTLTVFAIGVLLLQLDGVDHVARIAAEDTLSVGELVDLRRSLRFHAAGGLVVLLVTVVLSVYKPAGLTGYGWRKLKSAR